MKRCLLTFALVAFLNITDLLAQAPTTTPDVLTFDVTAIPLQSAWEQLSPTGDLPAPRYDHTLVFSEKTNHLLLFGGRGSETFGDTWKYDVAMEMWRKLETASGLEPRFGMGAVYDRVRDRALIFAGQGGNGFFNDVWAFDFGTDVWSRLETSGASPVARYGTSAVIIDDHLIISHGFASGRFDDTFALDLKTNTWADISPAERPLKRCLHEAAFDTKSEQMILFGGCSSGYGPCPQGDTWVFSAKDSTWMELKAEGPKPSPRSNPALIADGSGGLWLFGGKTSAGADGELWSLDVTSRTWTLYAPIGNMPSPPSSHDGVWDAVGNRILVFGGRGADGPLNDLWLLKLER
jgi:hypothetical protein